MGQFMTDRTMVEYIQKRNWRTLFMTVEHLVKRTLYVSVCPTCGNRKEVTEDPPKERMCNFCKAWVPFKAVSFTGPDRFDGK